MASDKERIEMAYKYQFVGANLERFDLRGKDLRGVNMSNANLRGADLAKADLRYATLINCDLSRACLHLANFEGADISASDLSMSYGKSTNFSRAIMQGCSIRQAIHKNCFYIGTDLTNSDFNGSMLLGSRFDYAKLTDVRNAHNAYYSWWMSPWGGPPSYEPIPGWTKIDFSVMGGFTVRENAAREKVEHE